MIESARMNDIIYLPIQYKTRKSRNFLLPSLFSIIGLLILVSSVLLLTEKLPEAEAVITSPITAKDEITNEYSYGIVYADKFKIIFKETTADSSTLKILFKSTNLTQTVASGTRVGFIGFLDSTSILYLKENEIGRFVLSRYSTEDKASANFLAFDGNPTIPSPRFDKVVSIALDGEQLAFAHKSGIVLYTLGTEKETTILENHNCDNSQNCIEYHSPVWITDTTLLVYQSSFGATTPLLTNVTGNILAVFPEAFSQIQASPTERTVFAGIVNGALYIQDTKKNTEVLPSGPGLTYHSPAWIDNNTLAVIAQNNNLPMIVKTDTAGKKVVTVKEARKSDVLGNLIVDKESQTLYFTSAQKNGKSQLVTFYKMEKEDPEPKPFFSISKTL